MIRLFIVGGAIVFIALVLGVVIWALLMIPSSVVWGL